MPSISFASSNFQPWADDSAQCDDCARPEALGFRFSYSYQPIVDVRKRQIYAHEALVRGSEGEPAPTILSRINEDNRYRFDQACRVKAIKVASELGMQERLSINFLPNAIYKPELCIRTTLRAAHKHAFPVERIIFEATEGDAIEDGKRLASILTEYKRTGFLTAIDDFGAGYAGLVLLAEFQPDLVKLDMGLIRGIDTSPARRTIVAGITGTCVELGCVVLAEGVETVAEYRILRGMGITLFQGYLFARPALEALPEVDAATWDLLESAA
jgi:EAL domain-containing protein (putative c-di-GMP-specific phosphodiesterase class I)